MERGRWDGRTSSVEDDDDGEEGEGKTPSQDEEMPDSCLSQTHERK